MASSTDRKKKIMKGKKMLHMLKKVLLQQKRKEDLQIISKS